MKGGATGVGKVRCRASGRSRYGSVACTDVFGNTGGDWSGCLTGLNGTSGNISADPLSCDSAIGNLALRPGSPCAPANSACGQIGADGVGSGTTALWPTTWGEVKGMYR